MNIARQSVQCLSGLALLITAFCGVSHGQQRFPEVFHGVWIVGVAEDNSGKAGDWDKHENDGLLRRYQGGAVVGVALQCQTPATVTMGWWHIR